MSARLVALVDTPSRIVREQPLACGEKLPHRYTLTYSEGTWVRFCACVFAPDTPSRIVREPARTSEDDNRSRYTLTYSEGTKGRLSGTHGGTIHPHV